MKPIEKLKLAPREEKVRTHKEYLITYSRDASRVSPVLPVAAVYSESVEDVRNVDEFFDLYREIWRYVEDWDSLDEEKKEKLKRFAYAMLEMEEEGNKVISKHVRNPFDRLKIYLYAIYLFVEFNRNPEKLFDMVTMTQKIVDEILDRVEMDRPRFQRDLKRALENFDKSKITEIDDSDEFMHRMRERYLKKKFV